MRAERNEDLCLRIGVRQGGCSGMSYTMEFENQATASPDDSIIEYDGFAIGIIFILAMQYFCCDFGITVVSAIRVYKLFQHATSGVLV
jgi:hypothetical protein